MKKSDPEKIEPKLWKISNKNKPKSQEYHVFFSKMLILLLDIDVGVYNNPTEPIFFTKVSSNHPDPDPFHEEIGSW